MPRCVPDATIAAGTGRSTPPCCDRCAQCARSPDPREHSLRGRTGLSRRDCCATPSRVSFRRGTKSTRPRAPTETFRNFRKLSFGEEDRPVRRRPVCAVHAPPRTARSTTGQRPDVAVAAGAAEVVRRYRRAHLTAERHEVGVRRRPTHAAARGRVTAKHVPPATVPPATDWRLPRRAYRP